MNAEQVYVKCIPGFPWNEMRVWCKNFNKRGSKKKLLQYYILPIDNYFNMDI